jgi:hypothetical protein
MPEISRFYGIIIQMLFDDHNPPHFHAIYGGHKAVISIEKALLLKGELPPRALKMVMDWTEIHRQELLDDWKLAKANKETFRITPLE